MTGSDEYKAAVQAFRKAASGVEEFGYGHLVEHWCDDKRCRLQKLAEAVMEEVDAYLGERRR